MKENFYSWLKIFSPPFAILIIHFFLIVSKLYLLSYWVAETMHVVGGIAIGFTYFFILNFLEANNHFKAKSFIKVIFIISLVALTAVFWEFHEFVLDYFFHTGFQISNADTMLDLFLGLCGGTFISIFLESIYH